MKKQLSILQTFLVTCLLLAIGGGSSLAQETPFFSETFGSTTSNTEYSKYSGYSADKAKFTTGTAKDNYTGEGKIGKNSLSSQNLSNGYDGASGKSGIYQSGTAGTNKIIIKMSNINIKGYSKIKLGFGALFGNSEHKIIAKYSIDGGAEKELSLSEYKPSTSKWSYITALIPDESGKSLTLTFSHTPKKNWTIRMDDISLKGTNPNVKTFKFSATTCTAMLGATNNEFPTLSNDYGTPVTYSSSNTNVASVSVKDGTLNLKATGTTTITATLDADKSVTASYELTVNQKTTDVVFDFTAKPNVWGIEPGGNLTSNTDGKDLYMGGVKLNTTSGTGYETCIYSSSTPTLRVYSDGSLTFTAPLGYNISKIVFTGSASFSPSDGTFSNNIWTDAKNGSDKVVKLTYSSSTSKIETASVSLVKVANAESISLPASNNDGTYATFSCSRDVIFTEDVIVNAVKVEDGSLVITPLTTDNYQTSDDTNTELTGYYVPANTGVLISGNKKNNNTQVYYPAENQAVTIDNNQLKPAPINGGMIEAVKGNKYYKLAYSTYTDTNKTGLGFYWGEKDGGAFKVKSGTAYLEVPVTLSPAKGFAFGGDETGITNIDANSSNSRVIYNLAGQRISDTVKPGLYIINGKKTVVR